jgi:tetrahydromethanopterin S-methyltransferase subunit H
MSGKIFDASANIYQDQAKVLFDYYKQAAEKIVSEEEKYEKEIAICKETMLHNLVRILPRQNRQD